MLRLLTRTISTPGIRVGGTGVGITRNSRSGRQIRGVSPSTRVADIAGVQCHTPMSGRGVFRNSWSHRDHSCGGPTCDRCCVTTSQTERRLFGRRHIILPPARRSPTAASGDPLPPSVRPCVRPLVWRRPAARPAGLLFSLGARPRSLPRLRGAALACFPAPVPLSHT